jgi:hypothetical protein
MVSIGKAIPQPKRQETEMNASTSTSSRTSTIAPIVGVLFLVAATHWVVQHPAGETAPEPAPVSTAFEYYPAQFPSPSAESAADYPTF